ncbi:phosphate/phosphite/phosphonate ABC transporter substrate-binding protein [Fischerella thermalis CCMEE 5273]|jgi:phosphonate transport system substrate-binding protein|uniref:Phosphonate ABC transporter, periplasmic phosphonate-binding protein n=1 Tax=Fischerella thermalis JSC-11 TaxID=741277 RepID=G6FQS7_9CYAN|nr:phosphate/phosphite/phosphonate ABC transporter substrate-binding protein [Fischerella thermalis]PMB01671.1 phosphate/phosphite/phosphonate ABC transporter substrate-binding protein [Fischerella thermalis CCMEE 5328]PMB06866.1 phosphate/phosphite/phosphonate ABC transporter substrate-binding protein [Fischerella thermalis CCMEE 5273]EHC18162.1 phosphonate ABC transporter, periplasmic phosphonate-binding protein [Fischerella thermalis JSC-11]PLZ08880.1 phosphonate ABC transporter substrate-bi
MRLMTKGVLGVSVASVALAGMIASTFGEKSAIANLIPDQKEQTLLAQGKTNELVVIFPSRSDSTDLQNKANAVAAFLSKQLGVPVKAQIGDDTAAVEALRANRADIAFLSSRPALKAEQLANARLYLAEVRPTYSGKYTYNSVFVVPKNSPLKTQSTAKATLTQLRGKRMAFTSPTSGSGFIFPTAELVKQGLVPNRDRLNDFFGQVTYGGNYSKAIQAVLRGQADVAAVSEYALNPPYITEAEKNQLRILHKIPGVPAHGVAIDDDVPVATRNKIINAMLLLNQPQNNQLLRNLYNSTELVKIDHNQHLAPLRNALQLAGIQP